MGDFVHGRSLGIPGEGVMCKAATRVKWERNHAQQEQGADSEHGWRGISTS